MPTKQYSVQATMIQLHCSLIISLLFFCSLNLSAEQIPKPKDKDKKEEIVRGYFNYLSNDSFRVTFYEIYGVEWIVR